MSRQHPTHRAETDMMLRRNDPGVLLRVLSDDELAIAERIGRDAMETLDHSGGEAEDLVMLVWNQLAIPIREEQNRRAEVLRKLRIDVEANGHEVWIDHDQPATPPWWAYCECDWRHNAPTETAAVAAGDQHIAETRGAWASNAGTSDDG